MSTTSDRIRHLIEELSAENDPAGYGPIDESIVNLLYEAEDALDRNDLEIAIDLYNDARFNFGYRTNFIK